MSGAVFPAAKLGDRVSHAAAATVRSVQSLAGALIGQALSALHQGGALLAQVGAAVSCAGPKAPLSVTELLPAVTNGVIATASPTVIVAPGSGAAIAGAAPVTCQLHLVQPLVPAALTVLVQGLPLARSGGVTTCGALLCDGAKTVLAGGPSSTGGGCGTQAGSPLADAVAYADKLAGGIEAAAASVERGAALIEQTVTETVAKVEGVATGAVSAIAGTLAGLTKGGALGALIGGVLSR